MQFAISDLLFPGFAKTALRKLSSEHGIEFFYEFGKDYYWSEETEAWGKRSLSIHGPCVAVNLAAAKQKNYTKIFEKTFVYAQKIKANSVVVHTNEAWEGDRELVQARVIRRLRQLLNLAGRYNVQLLIENVGLRTKNTLLFDLQEYMALFDIFPAALALLDTGHAHVNGWDLPAVVEELGERLGACHVHDNDGSSDAHLPVGQGDIEWKEYFAAIKKYAPEAVQVLEYCCGFADAAAVEAHLSELQEQYKLK